MLASRITAHVDILERPSLSEWKAPEKDGRSNGEVVETPVLPAFLLFLLDQEPLDTNNHSLQASQAMVKSIADPRVAQALREQCMRRLKPLHQLVLNPGRASVVNVVKVREVMVAFLQLGRGALNFFGLRLHALQPDAVNTYLAPEPPKPQFSIFATWL